jgi:hypothetical protein
MKKRFVVDLPTLPIFTDEACQRCGGYGRELDLPASAAEVNHRAGLLGYSQKEVAALVDLTGPKLCDILKGRRTWSISKWLQLATALQ